jgi:hypothetical protein
MRDSFRVYGFDYAFDGRRYTFAVEAVSAETATAQALAMREFEFVGELKELRSIRDSAVQG